MKKEWLFPWIVLGVGIFLICPARSAGSWSQPNLTLHAPSAVLLDGTTGQILFEKNPEERFAPASLTKVMTLYLAFDALKRRDVKFDDQVLVSKRAWKMGGSQMFLEVGDRVKFIELIKGVATISANDGALAIAEFLTGSEEVFVHEMNEKARALGMEHTRFVNPHGLPREGQHTCAMDMAVLGLHYLHDHPEALEFHALRTYTYGGIKQKNWNPLLGLGVGVDGLKTGYLKTSGYHILFTAKKGDRRIIGVVMGADTADHRNNDALKLIGYGFKNFSNRALVKKGDVVARVDVPNGTPPQLALVAARSVVVTVPKAMEGSLPVREEIPSSVKAPIKQGEVVGKLVFEGEGFPSKEVDLLASQDVQVRSYVLYYALASAAVAGLLGLAFWRRRFSRRKRQ
ncbi:MAG: D-alanyl-D-alanine carboxypeptidase [Deltaproteobacteria bacterium]|nr:D-alanyl-D-alanine carboxypeptidase [Deltaproteobacteria bacterium]MBW2120705.1 D-alanyl-D-alanine carboxypeptidase [Deltaproteobacteria bacterium]